jgi:Cytochrome oxidase complex assembly protein 1
MGRHSTLARVFASAVIVLGVTAFSSFSVTALAAAATSTAFVDVSIPKMNVNRSLCKFKSYGYHQKTSILHRRWMIFTYKSSISTTSTATRLYHSSPQRNFFRKDDNNNKDTDTSSSGRGILGQVKNIAKKVLPSSWFQSDEERRQIVEKKRVQNEITSEIKQIFKDAPLPIRMLTNMIGPVFSGVMSSLAETAASQQSMVDMALDQAAGLIQNDVSVQQVLGDSISVGRPFSQSSSSSSINGATTTRVELAFPVSGRRGEGIGRLVASRNGNGDPNIQRLEVQANERVIVVNTVLSSLSSSNQYSSNIGNHGDDNIIDAEIIEKDTTKRK